MSWNIAITIHEGVPEITAKSGDLPEGPISLYGHHHVRGKSFGMSVDGASFSTSVPYPDLTDEEAK